MVKVKLNVKRIERAAQEAFRENCFAQGRVFSEIFDDPGAFPDFPGQDIVDKGILKNSQELTFPNDTTGKFTWSTEEGYGLYVHDGFTRRNGTVVPGRPWTVLGLQRYDFEAGLAKLMASKLR